MRSLGASLSRLLNPDKYRNWLRRLAIKYNIWKPDAEYSGLTNKAIFEKIYKERKWGSNSIQNGQFFSGPGSHDDIIVNLYVEHVRRFLNSIGNNKTIVDLGCGDFNVGSKLAPYCYSYIACDIVPDLIEHNKKIFSFDNVEFRVVDLVDDELPCGDVIFVRQVLQHLSNTDILRFTNRIHKYCQYLILTEHLPPEDRFFPNIDKQSGQSIRPYYNSGIDLSLSPFNLTYKTKKTLCEHQNRDGIIRTTVFTF